MPNPRGRDPSNDAPMKVEGSTLPARPIDASAAVDPGSRDADRGLPTYFPYFTSPLDLEYQANLDHLLANLEKLLMQEYRKAVAARERHLTQENLQLKQSSTDLRQQLGQAPVRQISNGASLQTTQIRADPQPRPPPTGFGRFVCNGEEEEFSKSLLLAQQEQISALVQEKNLRHASGTDTSDNVKYGTNSANVGGNTEPLQLAVLYPGTEPDLVSKGSSPNHRSSSGLSLTSTQQRDGPDSERYPVFKEHTVWRMDFSSYDERVDSQMSHLPHHGNPGGVNKTDSTRSGVSKKTSIISLKLRDLYLRFVGDTVGLIGPSSPFFLSWNVAFMVALCYELMVFPLAVFDIPQDGFLFAMSVSTTVFWCLDLIVACSVGYYADNGDLVMKRCRIILRYAKSWMLPDILLVTIDVLLLAVGTDGAEDDVGTAKLLRLGKMARYVRTLRLLRLLRLRKLCESVRLLDEFFNSEFFSIMKSMTLNVTSILVISHFVGCLWFLVGSSRISGYDSWVDTYSFQKKEWVYQYLTCMHWALTQITPGSMHVQPQNIPERAVAVLVLVMGMIAFSSIVSSITAATNQLKNINARYDRERWSLRRFFREKQISAHLTVRVTRYADANIKPQFRLVARPEVELLGKLPKSMMMDVMLELYDQDIVVHPFFDFLRNHKKHLVVMQKLCTNVLKQINLSDGDVQCHLREKAETMYFVTKGQLSYVQIDQALAERISILKEKDWLCEAVLWTPDWIHRGTTTATMDSELLALPTTGDNNFQGVLTQHIGATYLAKHYCQEFLRKLNEVARSKDEDGGIGGDVPVLSDLVALQIVRSAMATLPQDVS